MTPLFARCVLTLLPVAVSLPLSASLPFSLISASVAIPVAVSSGFSVPRMPPMPAAMLLNHIILITTCPINRRLVSSRPLLPITTTIPLRLRPMRAMVPLLITPASLVDPPPFPPQSVLNLLLLLLHQVTLHRIIVIMVHYELLQLHLLLQHLTRPLGLLLTLRLLGCLRSVSSLPPHDILPPNLPLLRILVVPLLVPRMVNPYQPPTDFRTP